MSKPILCLDFDGVIHSYASGWQGAAIIPDPPVEGAVPFIYNAVEQFRVAIYSSRSGQPGGIDAMRGWLLSFMTAEMENFRHAKRIFDQIEWPTEKPPALVTIDDRAITFDGTWPKLSELRDFQPWNKRPKLAKQPITKHRPDPELDRTLSAVNDAMNDTKECDAAV